MTPAGDGRATWMSRPRARGVLAVVSGVILSLGLTGWFGLDFRQPLSFEGDHLLTLGTARSFIDGNGFRWNDSVGFPGRRDSMYHATFYFVQKSIMWLTARVSHNPATVIHVFYGFGIALMFAACYWSLRQLSMARGVAWIGGLAFVVTPYFVVRSAFHDMIAVYFSVPIGAVLALKLGLPDAVASTRPLWRRIADPWSLVLVLIVGATGLYYAFFTTFFVAFVGILVWLSDRTVVPLVRAIVLCALMVVVLLVTGPGLGLVDVLDGSVQLTRRSPIEQYLFGLVVGDAVRVFTRLPFVPEAWALGIGGIREEGAIGEWPGLLLTLVILISPFMALRASLAASPDAASGRRRLVLLSASCLVFGMLFAMRGGFGLLFNQMITSAVRAHARIVPFLTYFAIVIVLVWLERGLADRRRWVRLVVPLTLVGGLAVSAAPYTGVLRAKQKQFLANAAEQADRQSIEAMVRRAHEGGVTAVLQLPVAAWPEAAALRSFVPYRFELAHILDHAPSRIKWSYGLSVRQPIYRQLAAVVDGHRERNLAGAAAGLGFDAIAIEKSALDAPGLAAWTGSIDAELPQYCRVFDDARRVMYLLGPMAEGPCAVAAEDVSLGRTRYATGAGRYGRTLLSGGWSAAEGPYSWSNGVRSDVTVPVPPAAGHVEAVVVTFTFGMFRPDPSKAKTIAFVVGGRELHRIVVAPGEAPPPTASFTIESSDFRSDGVVAIEIQLPDAERPSDYGAADDRRLGIALHEIEIRVVR